MATTKNGIYYPNDGTQPADVLGDMKKMAESIDENIQNNKYDDTEIAESLETLNNSISEIKQEQAEQNESIAANSSAIETNAENIEKNETDIQALQAENANLKAQIPTGTAEGEEISLSDSAEMELVEFGLQGNSRQETTKGLQILENTNEGVTGWNFVHGNGNANISEVVEDGIKCSKFTVTEAMSDYRVLLRDCNLKKLKNNSTYTIAYDLKMNKTGKFNTSICNTAGGNTLAGFPQVNYITADQWQHIKIVANTHDTTIDSQLLYMTVQPNENGFTEVGDYIEIRNLILAEGDYSEQDLDWERYTGVEAMPNLNYPSKVQAVGDNGSIEIVHSNKNLFNVNNANIIHAYFTSSKTISNNSGSDTMIFIPIQKNKKYTVSKILEPNISKNTLKLGTTTDYPNYGVTLNQVTGSQGNNITEATLTTTDKDNYLVAFIFTKNNANTYNEEQILASIQIEIADKATDFVEHQGNTYTLPIQKPMLQEDYFIKENNKWYEVHLREKRSIKDDITNAIFSTTTNFIYVDRLLNGIAEPVTNGIDANVSSNILKHATYNEMNFGSVDYGIGLSQVSSLVIRIKGLTTLEEYKNALNSEDYYYYFVLKNPTKLECTEEQVQVLEQIVKDGTYKGVTHYFTEDEVKPTLEVKYYRDLETIINKQEQLESTLNNVQAQILELGG